MNSNPVKVQSKTIFEPDNLKELLRGWLLHAHKGRDRHDLAARRNDSYRYWLGGPTIILSAVVGTSVFASLNPQMPLKIALGVVSITSAVLASLQTFYNFPSRGESHRMAGVKYKSIIREIEQVLAPLGHLPNGYLDVLRKRLDDLELEAPVVPEGIYRHVEVNYASVLFVEKVLSLFP